VTRSKGEKRGGYKPGKRNWVVSIRTDAEPKNGVSASHVTKADGGDDRSFVWKAESVNTLVVLKRILAYEDVRKQGRAYAGTGASF